MASPLAGVRALLVDAGIAGAYAGHLLARFGADVTLVEPPSGDPIRRMGPFPDDRPDREMGGWWLFLAAGLRSITLDLETSSGRRLLASLPADLTLAGSERAGLDTSGRQVVISPNGSEKPDGWPADSLLLAAAGGLMSATGEAEREPLAPPGPAVQVASGLFAAIAALHALRDLRPVTADLSLVESVAATVIYETTAFSYHGVVRRRTGPRYSSGLVLNRIFLCADGYVGLHLNTQPQWRALCAMMERPELVEEPRFRTNTLRAANVAELDGIVEPWVRQHTAAYLYHEGQRRRIPFSLIPAPSQVLASAQLNARDYFEEVEHPQAGTLRLPGPPFRVGDDRGITARAPLLGEHTARALAEAGVTAPYLAALRAAGAV